MSESIAAILNDILRVDNIDEGFSCFLVHRSNAERDKINSWQQEMANVFKTTSTEQTEAAVRQILCVSATCAPSRLQLLLELVERLIRTGSLPPRLVCETIITCDKLQHQNSDFWLECFALLHRTIDMVEYKVRFIFFIQTVQLYQ